MALDFLKKFFPGKDEEDQEKIEMMLLKTKDSNKVTRKSELSKIDEELKKLGLK